MIATPHVSNGVVLAMPDARLTRPVVLTLGAMIGMAMQKHYGWDDLLRRRLQRVDQKLQIALVHPPCLYASLPPATVMHDFRSYVIQEDDEQEAWVHAQERYRWRYNWWTLCGSFAVRVGIPTHQLILRGTRIQVYTAVPGWAQRCRTC